MLFPSAAAQWQKQQRQLTTTCWLSGWEAARTSVPSTEMKAGELLNFQGASAAPGEVADSSAAKVSSKSPQKSWALALLPSVLTRCQVGFSRRGCKTSNMHLSQGRYFPPSWEVTMATLHHSNRRKGNNPFPQNTALFGDFCYCSMRSPQQRGTCTFSRVTKIAVSWLFLSNTSQE